MTKHRARDSMESSSRYLKWQSSLIALALLVACSDSNDPTDPRKLSLDPGTSVPVFIHSQVTSTHNGRTLATEYQLKKTLKVGKERGKAKIEMSSATPRKAGPAASLTRGVQQPPNLAAFVALQSTDDINFTPVVAVTTGDYTGNFDVLDIDSVGNRVRTVASSVGSKPFSDVKVYQNAVLIGTIHSEWTPVNGGYVLSSQKQVNFDVSTASPTLTILTDVTLGYAATYQTAALKSGVSDFLGTVFRGVGRGVDCFILPKAAYAQYRSGDRYCWQEGAILAGVTAAIAWTLYAWARQPRYWFPSQVETTAFHMEMAGWAWALTDYLRCMNRAKKAGQRP